jgi:hypothetical protein
MYKKSRVRPGAPIEAIETGIDWVTLTCKQTDHNQPQFARAAWQAQTVQRRATKELLQPWSWRGYEGWRVTGLSYGKRKDGDIVVASGATANRYWRLFHKYSTNVSRLDLQVTTQLQRPYGDMVWNYYADIKTADLRLATIIENTRGGQTLYIGSRKSDQFGRVYDKGIESGLTVTPGLLWRYEVEYKGQRAKQMSNKLFILACRRRKTHDVITSTVYNWFDERGAEPIFPPDPDSQAVVVQLTAVDATAERQLRWLRVQVSPTVDKLLTHHRRECVLALGLGDLLDAGDLE